MQNAPSVVQTFQKNDFCVHHKLTVETFGKAILVSLKKLVFPTSTFFPNIHMRLDSLGTGFQIMAILIIYDDNYDILIDDAIVYPTEMPTTTVSYRGGRGIHI